MEMKQAIAFLQVRCKLNGKPLYILLEPRQVENGFWSGNWNCTLHMKKWLHI